MKVDLAEAERRARELAAVAEPGGNGHGARPGIATVCAALLVEIERLRGEVELWKATRDELVQDLADARAARRTGPPNWPAPPRTG